MFSITVFAGIVLIAAGAASLIRTIVSMASGEQAQPGALGKGIGLIVGGAVLCALKATMKLKEGHKHYYTYVCRYASYAEEHPCKKNRIKMEELEKLVSMLLHQQIEMFLDTEDLLKRLNREPKIRKIADGYDGECNEMKRKLEHTRVIISELYSDFTDGILEEADYLYAKKQYQNQINELEVKLAELEYLRDSHTADFSVNRKMDEIIRQYSDFTELTSELLNALIERITFYGDDRYEVKYRFGEEFRVLLELVEQRKDELSCVETV